MSENVKQLVIAGVNYKKTALEVRNKFALTTEKIKRIYEDETRDVNDFFILSTCNRTEVYAITETPKALVSLLASESSADENEAKDYTFVKEGEEAVQHLFQVASGLDSQILGDYEIIGQLKNAFLLSKQYGCLGGYLEKLAGVALQASRGVRNNTSISDGTTSTSYAVIQLLKQATSTNETKKVCLMGLGKIGALTLKNLKSYLPQHTIVVINRNEEKAISASEEFGVNFAPIEKQNEVLAKSDILIVATGADHAIIDKSQIENTNVKLIFDLSVPSNVSADVREISDVKVYDIDTLSKIVNETLELRQQQIPTALEIINEHIAEFAAWEERRKIYTAKQSEAIAQ